MRYITYEWQEDEWSGEYGFWPVNTERHPVIAPVTSGMALAHDLLEHQNGFARIGTLEDEIEAIGAILFVRGAYGCVDRSGGHCIYAGCKGELENLIEYRDPRPMRGPVPLNGDEEVTELLAQASSSIGDDDFLVLSRPWLLRGYAKAQRRFKDEQIAVNELFFQIKQSVDDLLRDHEPQEGDQIRLGWSLDDHKLYRVGEFAYE